MIDKEIEEELEVLSQKVRNYRGDTEIYKDLKHRLEKVYNYFEQIRITKNEEKN